MNLYDSFINNLYFKSFSHISFIIMNTKPINYLRVSALLKFVSNVVGMEYPWIWYS